MIISKHNKNKATIEIEIEKMFALSVNLVNTN